MITVVELSILRPDVPRQTQSMYVNQIRRHWCPFAKGQGKCNLQCSKNAFCQPVILRATNLADARNPVALLVYKLRNERTKAEKALASEAPQVQQVDTRQTFSGQLEKLGEALGI